MVMHTLLFYYVVAMPFYFYYFIFLLKCKSLLYITKAWYLQTILLSVSSLECEECDVKDYQAISINLKILSVRALHQLPFDWHKKIGKILRRDTEAENWKVGYDLPCPSLLNDPSKIWAWPLPIIFNWRTMRFHSWLARSYLRRPVPFESEI